MERQYEEGLTAGELGRMIVKRLWIVILAAIALILIVIIIVAIVVSVKKSKKKKAMQAERLADGADSPNTAAPVLPETATTVQATEETAAAEQTAEEQPAAEQLSAQETYTAPAEENIPAPEQDEETAAEPVTEESAPAEEVAETPSENESAETAPAEQEEIADVPPAPIEQAPADTQEAAPQAETENVQTEEPAAEKKAETKKRNAAPAAETDADDKRYAGKWVIRKNEETGAYTFDLLASNGEKLLSSIDYTSVAGARNGIKTHKANIAKDNFTIATSKNRQYFFKLMSGSKQILCTGETYKTKTRCENAIDSVKRFAETAVVVVDKGDEEV